jgi:Regulator of chromosome condensation (RCC1) repeat
MGSNIDGRLGISSRSVKSSSSPCLVEGLSHFRGIKVSCGSSHTAAIIGK